MFKPNPKKQVELKFIELFGRGHPIQVTGRRISTEEAQSLGYRVRTRDGLYLTELYLGGELLSSAVDRDWRTAYKLLRIEVEKLFSEGTWSVKSLHR